MPSIQFVSREQFRLSRDLAAAAVSSVPKDGDLLPSIVAGKKALDEMTFYSLIQPSLDAQSADPAESINGCYRISKTGCLPLLGPFSRRKIDDNYLWVDVENGRVLVLDAAQDGLMSLFCQGVSPSSAARNVDADDVHLLIGLLARSGFIRGIPGQVDQTVVDAKRFLRIHLTERCNLSCVHCYADSSPHIKAHGELAVEEWTRIISDFSGIGGERVLFTGGEALAYSGCPHLLGHSKQLGLHVTLFTNGILVPKFLDAICAAVDEVQISIDGASASSNDPIRGVGTYDKAVRAVDLLAARGVPVRISTVAMRDNWEDIKSNYLDFASRWKELPVTFKINYGIMTHGRGEALTDELDINETRPVVDEMMASLNPGDAKRIARRTGGCGYAEQIVVAPNGKVHPCHLLSGAISSLRDESIQDVLTTLADTQAGYSVDTSVGCKTCDIRHLCGGTCRVENAKRTGNLRVTYCDAQEKLRKLVALTRTFA